MKQLHHSKTTPAKESTKSTIKIKKLKKFQHSTDISSNEEDRPEETQKLRKKKKYSRNNIISDSSSEEEENVNQKSQVRNISKRSTKRGSTSTTSDKSVSEAVIQQTEGSIPEGWQGRDNLNEENLPTVRTGRTRDCKVKTQFFNGFFQRESEEKENTAGNNQETNRSMKYWIGTKTYPLVDHSAKQEEKVVGPQQHQNK